MAFQFLPNASRPEGTPYYPTTWDPVRRVVLSDNPALPGYDSQGRLKPKRAVYTGPFAGVSQAESRSQGLAPIFSGLDLSKPANQRFVQQPRERVLSQAGSSPVYPLNVPEEPGISTITVPKSENVSAATAGMFDDLIALGKIQKETNASFATKYPEWFKNQEQINAAESGATRGLYTGEQEAKTNALLADYETKANAANAKSIADVQRLTSRSALASDASGYSSARDRGRFSAIADINAKAAAQSADRALLAHQWLTQLQQQMAGAQAARNRLSIGDVMLPATVATNSFENILRQLAILSPVEQNNLLTGLVGPGGYVADSFSGLQSAKLGDLARMSTDAQAADRSSYNWANLTQNAALQPLIERTSANNAAAAINQRYARYGIPSPSATAMPG